MAETPANLRPEAFAGTASAYLRYRPPYPKALLEDLLARAGIGREGGGVLVDLASGPGRLALDLAGAFERVLAIDLEPEMVAAGRSAAERRGIGNVEWRVGRAEELVLEPGSVDLVAIGEAFHRLDQGRVAAAAHRWLKPGGGLALLGTEGILAGREPWQKTAAEVARRWMARAFPQGWGEGREGADLGPEGTVRVLRRAGFADVESREFAEPRAWPLEAVIGYLRSTSVCSQAALGADFPAFEAELAAALSAAHGTGPFHEAMRAGYTLGRKPLSSGSARSGA